MPDRVIHRYVIPVNDRWHLLELRGPIVHVATRHEDCMEVWALNDPAAKPQMREFRAYGTGHPINAKTVHVGSAVTPSGRLVWHLMELSDRGAS